MSTLSDIARIAIPDVYLFLLEPAPVKVIYGGRNGGKDWNTIHCDIILSMLYDPSYTVEQQKEICTLLGNTYGIKTGLIAASLKKPHRILYCREIMSSIRKSVYTTIKDRIMSLGLESKWQFRDDRITCVNGSEFLFAGLYRDPHNIKSIEGITLCRAVEAENVSDPSWTFLVPTIRAANSELLVSFNTRYTDDPTYIRWVSHPPAGTVVKKVNSHDLEGYHVPVRNPDGTVALNLDGSQIDALDEDGQPMELFFTKEARRNRENDFLNRRWEYDNVWLGEPLAAGRKIYPMFSRDLHVKHFEPEYVKKHGNFFMAMDPAQKYYPFVLFGARFPDESGQMVKYIYAEYPSYDDVHDFFAEVRTKLIYSGTLKELATAFAFRGGENDLAIRMRARFIDTRFASGSGGMNMWSNSTTGIVEEFLKRENGGMVFECPDVTMIDGQRANIILDMAYNPLFEVGASNHPALAIDPSCQNLIQSLENHRLEEKSEKEHPRYKDASDTLRILYAGMADDRYQYEPPGMSTSRLEYRWGRRNRGNDDRDAYLRN